jgi:hypothetical protein
MALAALATLMAATGASASGDKADAAALSAFLDGLHVEDHWPAGVHVNWETGDPDGRVEHFEGRHTHCSAFVASAAKQLGVYILRPPEHGQALLANAQFEWLRDKGAGHGWYAIADGYEAQRAANRGILVVASFENADAEKSGHIAIVRPTDRDRNSLLADGPSIVMAGEHNYNSTTVRHGFANHRGAFDNNEIRYWGHALP